MSEPIVLARKLHKTFQDVEAVKGISFTVLRGEIFSLLGPNGAGKSTTISMLSCLVKPTSGSAAVAGYSILDEPMKIKAAIGVVPQEIALYGSLTGRQNLLFWGQMHDLSGKALKSRIEEVLGQVSLTDRANHRVETYSGGMKRRLNIAAALLHRPQLLFMDEPTVGIDPQSRRRILEMVTELRDAGTTIFYTSHYMEEVEAIADRVGIIDHGELIALGSQQELTQLVGEQETLHLYPAEGFDSLFLAQQLVALPGVCQASAVNGETLLTVQSAGEALPAVVAKANSAGIRIRSIDIQEPNLETVFLHLTGHALRD